MRFAIMKNALEEEKRKAGNLEVLLTLARQRPFYDNNPHIDKTKD